MISQDVKLRVMIYLQGNGLYATESDPIRSTIYLLGPCRFY